MSATPCLKDIDPWVVERLEMWPGYRGRARCPDFVKRVVAIAREVFRRQRRNRYGVFPLDRRALSGTGILPYPETQIRRVISVLAQIGFIDHFDELTRHGYRYAARHYSFGPGIRALFGLSEPAPQPAPSETKATQIKLTKVSEDGTVPKASSSGTKFIALGGEHLVRAALRAAAVEKSGEKLEPIVPAKPQPVEVIHLPRKAEGQESREEFIRRWREAEERAKAEEAERTRAEHEAKLADLAERAKRRRAMPLSPEARKTFDDPWRAFPQTQPARQDHDSMTPLGQSIARLLGCLPLREC